LSGRWTALSGRSPEEIKSVSGVEIFFQRPFLFTRSGRTLSGRWTALSGRSPEEIKSVSGVEIFFQRPFLF
ncbi:hypothetical protein, partial [Salmonella enterica]|uniref:hypothetical protein n=1 Tax=Salmonella enterica TaxID=28901 RepID=UPI002FCD86E0